MELPFVPPEGWKEWLIRHRIPRNSMQIYWLFVNECIAIMIIRCYKTLWSFTRPLSRNGFAEDVPAYAKTAIKTHFVHMRGLRPGQTSASRPTDIVEFSMRDVPLSMDTIGVRRQIILLNDATEKAGS